MSNAKLNAAKSAAELIPESGAIGLGSGSTVAIFAEELGKRIAARKAEVKVIPSSYQAYQLAVDYEIRLTNLDIGPEFRILWALNDILNCLEVQTESRLSTWKLRTLNSR